MMSVNISDAWANESLKPLIFCPLKGFLMPDPKGLDLIVWQHLHGFGFLKQIWEGEDGMVLAFNFIESMSGLYKPITKNAEAMFNNTPCFANCVHGIYCASARRYEIFY